MYQRFVMLLILLASSAMAEPERIEINSLQLGLSVGVGGSQTPVTGSDNVFTPVIPHVRYYAENWYFDDFSLGYNLLDKPWLLVDAVTLFNQDGFYFELDGVSRFFIDPGLRDNPRPWRADDQPLAPSKPIKRNLSYMGGVAAIAPLKWATVTAGVFTDISGVHQGQELRLNARRRMYVGHGSVSIEVGLTYKSKDIIEYYYLPRADEFDYPLAPIELNSVVNRHIAIGGQYPLTSQLSLRGQLRYEWLDSGLSHSPVVDRNRLISGFIGLSYFF